MPALRMGIGMICAALLHAGSFSLLDYRLSSLKGDGTVDLKAYAGKPLYLTFFKQNCRWCGRQLAAFETLMAEGDGAKIHVIAVGMGTKTFRLRSMARRVRFPAVHASEKLLRDIGGVPVTPYTLVTDAEGNFVTKIVGYQNSEALKKFINQKGEDQ